MKDALDEMLAQGGAMDLDEDSSARDLVEMHALADAYRADLDEDA